jgi:hypothetical protein
MAKFCPKCQLDLPSADFVRGKSVCRLCDNKRRADARREKPLLELLNTTRRRAEDKGFGFDLTLDYLHRLYAVQDGRCYHFKVPLVIDSSEAADSPLQVSIDRLDNDRGYLKGNVALTCFAANLARNKWSVETFTCFVRQLPQHLTAKPSHHLHTLMRKLADPRPVLISGDEDVVLTIRKFLESMPASTLTSLIRCDGTCTFAATLPSEVADDLYIYLRRSNITRAIAFDVQGCIHEQN